MANLEGVGEVIEGPESDDGGLVQPELRGGGLGIHIVEGWRTQRITYAGGLRGIELLARLRVGELPLGRFRVPGQPPGIGCGREVNINRADLFYLDEVLVEPLVRLGLNVGQCFGNQRDRIGIRADFDVSAIGPAAVPHIAER